MSPAMPALALAMTTMHVGEKRRKPDDLYPFYERRQRPYAFRLSRLPLQETNRLEVGV